MKYAVETHCLTVYIRGRKILDCINLKVEENTIHAILGPSGSGKTTLLRVINRLIDLIPDTRIEGEIKVLGMDAKTADPYTLRRQIGIVFQNPNPFPHLTIYENVAIGPRLHRLAKTRKELDKIVEWALRKAMLWDEVKHRLHEPPTRLSGGQKQRLCLARALATKPKLLLLDEPTANIDPANTRKIEQTLQALKNETTIILVTHSPQQAKRVADQATILYMGRIVEQGPADKTLNNPSTEIARKLVKGEL